MKEHPILFNADMVRALLDGRKVRKKLYVRKGENQNDPEHLAKRLAWDGSTSHAVLSSFFGNVLTALTVGTRTHGSGSLSSSA